MAKSQTKRPPIQPQRKSPNTDSGFSDSFQILKTANFGWLLAAFAVLLYANTFSHEYCLDDATAIAKNQFVQEAEFAKIFSTEYRNGYSEQTKGMLYRPVSLAVFAILWQISPDNPSFYHIFNVFLYGLLAYLLWRTWRSILHRYSFALPVVAIALFVAHPVHTEVVANIKSMDEILALLFFTAALNFLWKHHIQPNRLHLIFALLLYTCSLFSKESSIVFLGIFPLVLYFFAEKPLLQVVKSSVWLLLPAVFFLVVRQQVLAGQGAVDSISPMDNVVLAAPDLLGKIATACWFFWKYLQTLLFPYPLYSEFGASAGKPVQFTDIQAIAGAISIIALSLAAILGSKKKHLYAFAFAYFLVTFSLSTNLFFRIGTSYGERLLFAPSLGFALLLGAVIFWMKEKWSLSANSTVGLVTVLILTWSLISFNRNPDWKTSWTLCVADLPKAPESARLNFHYAIELAQKNETALKKSPSPDPKYYQDAIAYCDKALAAYPNFYKVKEVRGLANYALGNKDLALPDLLAFWEQEPLNRQLPPKIARIYTEQGQPILAEAVLKKSIGAGVNTYDNHLFLGIVYFKMGRKSEAIAAFEKAQKINPADASVAQYLEAARQGN